MAKHDVKFSVPRRPLANADIEFDVAVSDGKLGTLRVSKGGLVWYPTKGKNGLKLTWTRFGALAVEHGHAAEQRTRSRSEE